MMIATLEELTANAWPGLQTAFYDGWVLRFASGYTRRANSILPLYPSRTNPTEKLAWCESLYRQRGLPTIFKLPGREASRDLSQFLIDRGYQPEADTSVQLADLRAWAGDLSPSVRLSTTEEPAWAAAFRAMHHLRADQFASHQQIVAAILPQKCFASIEADGEVIACALGVLQDQYIGIYDVIVHPAHRGKGCGAQLMRSLLAWGRQQGAAFAYLQVMLNNPPALRLYERLGFREQYQYWYCVKPL